MFYFIIIKVHKLIFPTYVSRTLILKTGRLATSPAASCVGFVTARGHKAKFGKDGLGVILRHPDEA